MERPEEQYAREHLARKFGVELRKLPESGVLGHRTPDYEMVSDDVRIAVLEVKQIERVPRTREHGWVPDLDSPFQTRRDNAPTKVGRLIYDAWGQLKKYPVAKILLFVNDETRFDVHDLEEAFSGFMVYGTEGSGYLVNEASKKIAQGIIRAAKKEIDLYIWFDRVYDGGRLSVSYPAGGRPVEETRDEGPVFRCATTVGYDLARRFFGCPEIPQPTDPQGVVP